MKPNTILAAGAIFLLGATCLAAQDTPVPPNPDVQAVPAAAAPATPAASRLSPKQQVTSFYAMCKQARAGEGLREMLSTNPVTQPEDVQRVANAFAEIVTQMGEFLDFGILRESKVSERVEVIRCVAHFDRQPFVNEFTFYEAGGGEWRLVHMRYDANLASMFLEDVRAAAQ